MMKRLPCWLVRANQSLKQAWAMTVANKVITSEDLSGQMTCPLETRQPIHHILSYPD